MQEWHEEESESPKDELPGFRAKKKEPLSGLLKMYSEV